MPENPYKEKVAFEWKGKVSGPYTAVCVRARSGRWMTGTRAASGNYAGGSDGDSLRYVSAQEAREWLEAEWGYLPVTAYTYFPDFAEGDEVTSPEFNGTGTVVYVRVDQGVTSVGVRLPEDSGVDTLADIAAYSPEELRHAEGEQPGRQGEMNA